MSTPLHSKRHGIPTSTPAEDHTYYTKDMILQAPEHTPTSL